MSDLMVCVDKRESLASLGERVNKGDSVLRTAHAGNLRNYNLALAAFGVPMVLLDRNITGIDKNYAPEALVSLDSRIVVAPRDRLVFRHLVQDARGEETFLDELHCGDIRRAFPGTSVRSSTGYLRDAAGIAGDVTSTALSELPELFRRVVDRAGAVHVDPDRAGEHTRKHGLLQLRDEPRVESGVLIPNEVELVVYFIVEALRTGRATLFHVAGPDMTGYLRHPKSANDSRTPLELIARLFSAVTSRFAWSRTLPNVLRVQLVTGAAARFVTTMERRSRLDDLLAAADVVGRDPSSISEFRRTAARCPEVFDHSRSRRYLSQSDVVDGGLYVPARLTDSSMAELEGLWQRLQHLLDG